MALERNYYYERLTGQEMNIYDAIYSSILSRENCTLYGSSTEQVEAAYEAVTFDHPEILYHPGILYTISVAGSNRMVSIRYSSPDQSLFDEAFSTLTQKIENCFTSDMSDYERYKVIYDHLTEDIEYDYDILDEYFRISSRNNENNENNEQEKVDFVTRNTDGFTPYGVIVNKKGVCMGIAKAYKLLCEHFSLPCVFVRAMEKTTQAEHALNVIELDGVCAFVDPTLGLVNEDIPMHRYDLFCATNKSVDKFYDIKGQFDCPDESLSYFSRRGLRFTSAYDLRIYLESYDLLRNNKEVRFHYDGNMYTDDELQKLFKDVIQEHLCSRYKIRSFYVKNGFGNMPIFECD